MPDLILDANQVGELVTYVAPGFLARLGYRTRFPARERPAGEVLIISAVASLPLVALVSTILPGKQEPTQLGYVALLLAGAFVLGFVAATIRGNKFTKLALGKVGYLIQPEGTIYAQTLKRLEADVPITIILKDGQTISGTPRSGPETPDDGINELYLTHPEALAEDTTWFRLGEGLIVPISEISRIILASDPTT